MILNKNRLKRIGKKLTGRVHESSKQNLIDRFNKAIQRGMILTKDGKEVTPDEWVELQEEPLRSMLKDLAHNG